MRFDSLLIYTILCGLIGLICVCSIVALRIPAISMKAQPVPTVEQPAPGPVPGPPSSPMMTQQGTPTRPPPEQEAEPGPASEPGLGSATGPVSDLGPPAAIASLTTSESYSRALQRLPNVSLGPAPPARVQPALTQPAPAMENAVAVQRSDVAKAPRSLPLVAAIPTHTEPNKSQPVLVTTKASLIAAVIGCAETPSLVVTCGIVGKTGCVNRAVECVWHRLAEFVQS